MLSACLPFQQLPWLHPCPYKALLHARVQVLLQLLNCCHVSSCVALIFGVGLHFALSSLCGSAALVVLPG